MRSLFDTAGEVKADLVCLSTLMTLTMDGMRIIIEDLKKAGIASRVMIWWWAVSPEFAKILAQRDMPKMPPGSQGYKGTVSGNSCTADIENPELVSVRRNRRVSDDV